MDDVEFVYKAHSAGIRELRRSQKREFSGYARTRARDTKIRSAIRDFGRRNVALACRNLVLSSFHRGENVGEVEYLAIDYALRNVEKFRDLCEGSIEEFRRCLEASLNGKNWRKPGGGPWK